MTVGMDEIKALLLELEDAAQVELDKRRPVEFEVGHPMFAYGYWLGKISGVGEAITLIDGEADPVKRSVLEEIEDRLRLWVVPLALIALAVVIALVLP